MNCLQSVILKNLTNDNKSANRKPAMLYTVNINVKELGSPPFLNLRPYLGNIFLIETFYRGD